MLSSCDCFNGKRKLVNVEGLCGDDVELLIFAFDSCKKFFFCGDFGLELFILC